MGSVRGVGLGRRRRVHSAVSAESACPVVTGPLTSSGLKCLGGRRSVMPGKSVRSTVVLGLWLLPGVIPAFLHAQGTANASLAGRVIDQTGAPVPLVTVTLTSPALQVPQVTTATDSDGAYKLLDLPA